MRRSLSKKFQYRKNAGERWQIQAATTSRTTSSRATKKPSKKRLAQCNSRPYEMRVRSFFAIPARLSRFDGHCSRRRRRGGGGVARSVVAHLQRAELIREVLVVVFFLVVVVHGAEKSVDQVLRLHLFSF
mmetsp:Transcript_15464/g.50611  ORF Transcript_15464/g.50611 Transcript_15464/m.50611 type:complete len:130 (+) Transcript_15464:846-1235(+)